jgi:hypothetical protein
MKTRPKLKNKTEQKIGAPNFVVFVTIRPFKPENANWREASVQLASKY